MFSTIAVLRFCCLHERVVRHLSWLLCTVLFRFTMPPHDDSSRFLWNQIAIISRDHTCCSYLTLIPHDNDHIPLLSSAVACWRVRRHGTFALLGTSYGRFSQQSHPSLHICWNNQLSAHACHAGRKLSRATAVIPIRYIRACTSFD